jgi:hypothetical protein
MAGNLDRLLQAYARRRPVVVGEPVELTPEELSALQALGYLEEAESGPPAPEARTP